MDAINKAVTADTILSTLTEWIEQKKAVSATVWIDAALKLNILSLAEFDKLAEMQQIVAKLKLGVLEGQTEKRNVSEAKMRVEASDEYKAMLKQHSKCDRIEEAIRIAKKQATLREFGG